MSDPGSPTIEQRSEYPDHLWLTDHDEAPPTDIGLYAISNANGTLPAFWLYRNITIPKRPPPAHLPVGPGPEKRGNGDLEKRLPSFVNLYGGNYCLTFQTQIQSPQNGECYGNFMFGAMLSMYIPSYTTGDVYNIYSDQSCTQYLQQLYQYVGCFTADDHFMSFFSCNVCG
jgi:hypothetical protein